MGTPQEMTDHTGAVIWKAEYKAWGECKAEKTKSNFFEDSEIISNNIRFQGQYFDEETGLHYNRYRYYSPYVGRFISKDPIGLLGGDNVYAYAPNPVEWVDPLGLMKCGLTGEEVGDATNLPIIKPNTPQWKQAVDSIKNDGKSKPNFRVQDKETANKMLRESKKNLPQYETYTDEKYKMGYEYHPNESHTINAPQNNLPHIKWSDYSAGKKAPSSGKGHIFYDE